MLPFPNPRDLPNAGIETVSLVSPALAGGFFTTTAAWDVFLTILLEFITTIWVVFFFSHLYSLL